MTAYSRDRTGGSSPRRCDRRQRQGRPVRVGLIGAGQMGTDIIVQTDSDVRHRSRRGRRRDHRKRVRRARRSPATARARPRWPTVLAGAARAIMARGRLAVVQVVPRRLRGRRRGRDHRRDRQPERRRRGRAGDDRSRQAHRDDERRGRRHDRRLPVARRPSRGRRRLHAGRRRRADLDDGARSISSRRSAIRSSPPARARTTRFDIDATPDAYVEEATRRNMNPRMLVEFVDGSKTMVEMVGDRQCHRPRARHARHARPGRAARLVAQGAVPARRRRRAVAQGRGRFHRRQGRGARRVRRRRDAPSAPARAHERPAAGRGPLLHVLPALSSDQPRSAAVLRRAPCSTARPHAAAAGARPPRSAPSPSATSSPARRSMRSANTAIAASRMTRADAHRARRTAARARAGRQGDAPIAKGDYLTYANCAPDERQQIVQVRRAQDDCVREAAAA